MEVKISNERLTSNLHTLRLSSRGTNGISKAHDFISAFYDYDSMQAKQWSNDSSLDFIAIAHIFYLIMVVEK